DLPPAGDPGARPVAADAPPSAALEREYRLEAELAAAHRQIRELQEQLSWQARLLKSAPEAPPPQSAAGGPEARRPGGGTKRAPRSSSPSRSKGLGSAASAMIWAARSAARWAAVTHTIGACGPGRRR